MKRRAFIAGLGSAAAWPVVARGQQSGKVYRIAIVHPSTRVAKLRESYPTFFERLREGRNLEITYYSGEGHTEQYAKLASDVVQSTPDLIFTLSAYMVRHFKAATTSIPIVAMMADPVAFGVVPSLAHPGGNITGVIVDAGLDLWGKRLALIREAVPQLSRVSFLASRAAWEAPPGAAVREAALQMGISLSGAVLDGPLEEPEYRRVFAALSREQVDALVVGDQAENATNMHIIVQLTEQARLPAIYPYYDFAKVGGLMIYTVDLADLFRHAVDEIHQILKGTKPGEIPFYQSSKFAFVINLRTARALGLEIPPMLLARADEVIE